MSELTIRRIGFALGAEVIGIDLSRPLDDATVHFIRKASLEHLLLCFRDQNLTQEQMVAFAGRMGVVDDNATVKHRDPQNPYVTMISSKAFEGKPWETFKNGENWHTDRSFKVAPTSYTLLNAKELPPVGGNTLFANQYLAYDALSPRFRALADDLSAIHLQTRKAAAMMAVQFPTVLHPLARIHPETNRRALYLGEHVRGFLGMTEEESAPILGYLNMHATRAEFCYRHVWSVNDLVMWDNRCLMHVAVRDYDHRPGAHPRHLWKASIQGEPTGKLYEEVVGRKYEQELIERPGGTPIPVRAMA
jgi:taurine dioxygenase